MRTPLLLLALLAGLTGTSAAGQAVNARVAAPGLRPAGLPEAAAQRISEAFAAELEAEALDVTTPQEISALLGAERQRQLLSCEQQSSSCLAELTSALDVQAVVTGTVAKIGSRLHANVKLLSPSGQVYGVFARSGRSEADLIAALADAAPTAAADVYEALGRPQPLTARSLRPNAQRTHYLTGFLAGLLFTAYGVEYERLLSPRWSAAAMPVFIYGDLVSDGIRTRDVGFEVFLSARFYVFGEVGNGVFAGPELQAGYGSTVDDGVARSGPLLSAGLLAGYAFTFPVGVTGSIGLGVYRHLGPFAFSDSFGEVVQFLPRLNVGYAF